MRSNKTTVNGSQDPTPDHSLGHSSLSNNPRNTIDKYRGWEVDLVREDVQKNTFPYAVLMEQWQGDFNIGTLVRNANAFGAREVYYIGNRKWDRRGSVGTYNYTSVNYLKDYGELETLKQRYRFIGVDCVPGSVPMETHMWEPESLLLFGEEGTGLTENTITLCEKVVHITQYGSVRSINAGAASGVAMYDLLRKLGK